jgi:hypothetical protein
MSIFYSEMVFVSREENESADGAAPGGGAHEGEGIQAILRIISLLSSSYNGLGSGWLEEKARFSSLTLCVCIVNLAVLLLSCDAQGVELVL